MAPIAWQTMSETGRAYLFDTDAILALLRPQPSDAYVRWLARIPREDQYTSAVVLAELYTAAHCQRGIDPSAIPDPVEELASRLLPALTVLPVDATLAVTMGAMAACTHALPDLPLPEAQGPWRHLAVGATALHYRLVLVTGQPDQYAHLSGLEVQPLSDLSAAT